MSRRSRPGQAVITGLLTVLAAAACAAPPTGDAATLERIRSEQREVEARHAKAVSACTHEFAVTACVDRARAERRSALDRLKRERLVIDDARRQRSAAERELNVQRKLRSADEQATRAAAQLGHLAGSVEGDLTNDRGPVKSGRAPRSPQTVVAPKTAPRGHDHQAAQRQEAQQAAQRASDAQRRLDKAEQHRKDASKRLEDQARKRPPAAGLPAPVAPGLSGSAPARH